MDAVRPQKFDIVLSWQLKGINHDQVLEKYAEYYKTYDEIAKEVFYKGPIFLGEYFNKHAKANGFSKDARILDVAAGTGLVGRVLKDQYGYTNIDAIDGSQAMLDKANESGNYKNMYCSRIGGGYRMPIDNNTYDAAVMTGGLCEGHLKCDSFLDLIRVVRPGGLIVNVMREENIRGVEEYHDLQPSFKKWEDEKRWECIEEVIPPVKYYVDLDGLVHVYRVL